MPSTVAGDDSTLAFVRSCHTSLPVRRLRALTVPSLALTMRIGPLIAGVDGFFAVLRRRQMTLPESAAIAHVSPLYVLT